MNIVPKLHDLANLKDKSSSSTKSNAHNIIKEILDVCGAEGDDEAVTANKFAEEFLSAVVGIANDLLIDLDNYEDLPDELKNPESEDEEPEEGDFEEVEDEYTGDSEDKEESEDDEDKEKKE
jgi:hypothetical protein